MPNQTTVDFLRSQIPAPSEFRTAEWDRVPLWLRERSFFMASVTEAEILERFQQSAIAIAEGEESISGARLKLREYLDEIGYRPEPGQVGTIKDLRTARRLNIALQTNVAMSRGFGAWVRQQQSLSTFPAWRYMRGRQVKVPRDWEARWETALAATTSTGATDGSIEMVALINHPLWSDPLFNRFGTPYPPFDFNSGMMVTPVGRREAKELGLLPTRERDPVAFALTRSWLKPQTRSLNEGLQTTPAVATQAVRDGLSERLQGFAEWDGDVLRFTDPNGTQKTTAPALAKNWEKGLPIDPLEGEPFPLLQRDSLIAFAADEEDFRNRNRTDAWEDLQRLIGRLENEKPAPVLHRKMKMRAGALDRFLSRIETDGYSVREEYPAEIWSADEEVARRAAPERESGVEVLLSLAESAAELKEVTALFDGPVRWILPRGVKLSIESVKRLGSRVYVNLMGGLS